MFAKIAGWSGALFLFFYGIKSFKSSFYPTSLIAINGNKQIDNRKKIILTTLAFSILNPHVYLDTIVLLGAVAAQYQTAQRFFFTIGASMASFIWFFSLGYGARKLSPFFKQPTEATAPQAATSVK